MNSYPNPFILQRADPYITKSNDGFYYFTASYPALNNADNGYDRIILRKSDTVYGLRDAVEHTIWKAHSCGIMAKHIWAPEIHYINGVWYIFFAAGNDDDIWNIRPYALRCKGDDPINDCWEELGRIEPCQGDESSFTRFSLDMTYFEHKGSHYLIWAEIHGNSSLYMAKINPDKPWQLITKPILLTKPEFPWEKVRFAVNEGASVLKTDDKIYVFFSASGTGEEYCMGLLWADGESDLMNPLSWHKKSSPVLETKDLEDEVGPGHNSFTVNEDGDLLLVYHARPSSHLTKSCGTYNDEVLYDPCRHTRIRKIAVYDETLILH